MDETWAEIPGFPRYQVSDLGRVRSRRAKGWGILAPRLDKDGYVRVDLRENGCRTTAGVHQLVAGAFLGPCPDGMEVCHENGKRDQNVPGNLRYDTHRGNMQDVRVHRRERWDANLVRPRSPAELAAVAGYRWLRAEGAAAAEVVARTWAARIK